MVAPLCKRTDDQYSGAEAPGNPEWLAYRGHPRRACILRYALACAREPERAGPPFDPHASPAN